MRLPGPVEIILIVIVAGIVLLAVRVLGTPARREAKKITKYGDADEEEVDYEERIKRTRRSRIQILGIVAIVVGVIVFISSLSMVKWIFWGPVGAIVIAVIGIATIFIARRR